MSSRVAREYGTSVCRRRSSRSFSGRIAGKTILMRHGQPPLGGLPEVGTNLVERLSLGVAAGECRNGSRKAARVWFRADNRGEIHGDIDDDGSSGRGITHG